MIKERYAHLIYIPFSGVGIADLTRKPHWLWDRMDAFFEYTLPSLRNQTNQVFTVWLSFAPEDEHRREVNIIKGALKELGINYITTFTGLMYWDDKFSHKPMDMAKNAARLVRQCYRTGNWRDLPKLLTGLMKNKNDTLIPRLTKAVDLIKVYLHDVDWILMTRLDSDDMLAEDAVALIQSAPRATKRAYTFHNGYIYNAHTGDLAHYEPKHNPPFHTIVFPGVTFFDPIKHLQYYGHFKSHEDIPTEFEALRLDDGKFCVVIHSRTNQISTIWDHPYRGKIVEHPASILKTFGRYDPEADSVPSVAT